MNDICQMDKTLTDGDLIRAVQSGDFNSLSVIMGRYSPLVRSIVTRFHTPSVDDEDLFQEGVIALYSAVKVYDFSHASFSTFASLCIRRGIISALRHSSQKRQIPAALVDSLDDSVLLTGDGNPESRFIDKESYMVFSDRIRLVLSSFEYDVLTQYLRCGNYEDVCSSLQISRKIMDNALQRARKKIRKISSIHC